MATEKVAYQGQKNVLKKIKITTRYNEIEISKSKIQIS